MLINRAGWLVAGVLALFVVAALTGVVGGGPLDPPGTPDSTRPLVEPRIPISQPASAAGFPIMLGPGSYYLTEDIVGVSGEDGIRIVSGVGVTIDLNGFELRGGPGTLDGIRAINGESEQLTVLNGFVYEWGQDGIDFDAASNTRVEGVVARWNGARGIVMGGRSLLADCIVDAGNSGIRTHAILAGGGTLVRDCATRGYAVGIEAGSAAVVRGCRVTSATATGIVATPNSVVEDCLVHSVSGGSPVGIQAHEDTRIVNNTIADFPCPLPCVATRGVDIIGVGVRVEGNQIVGVTHGIMSTGGAVIFGNTLRGMSLANAIQAAATEYGPVISVNAVGASPWANILY